MSDSRQQDVVDVHVIACAQCGRNHDLTAIRTVQPLIDSTDGKTFTHVGMCPSGDGPVAVVFENAIGMYSHDGGAVYEGESVTLDQMAEDDERSRLASQFEMLVLKIALVFGERVAARAQMIKPEGISNVCALLDGYLFIYSRHDYLLAWKGWVGSFPNTVKVTAPRDLRLVPKYKTQSKEVEPEEDGFDGTSIDFGAGQMLRDLSRVISRALQKSKEM